MQAKPDHLTVAGCDSVKIKCYNGYVVVEIKKGVAHEKLRILVEGDLLEITK